jgi:hypothetical protein
MCGEYEAPFEVVGEGRVEVDLEEQNEAEETEPTQEEKEEAVREFAAWATTGEGKDLPFLDHEAIDQAVAAAEASGNWDEAFASAAYALSEVDRFMQDPIGTILSDGLSMEIPDNVRVVGI